MPKPERPPVGLQLARTAKSVSRAFDEALAQAGGSVPVWLVLISIKSQDLGNQRELAEAVGIKEATLTHHLNAMDAQGLVTRKRDPANRRAIIVLARSTNGGQSFVNYSWIASAFNLEDQVIGDYTGLAAFNGQVYGAWTERVSKGTAALAGPNSTLVKVGTANFQSRPQ